MTRLVAPAKLTWFLEITGQRSDGLHELRSEMLTLDLCDYLDVTDGDGLSIVGNDALAVDDTNLVRRALALVGRRAQVDLIKQIPSGGGLGGGSADAGAVLRWAGGVSNELALTLGSDVPFCQVGGRALVEGVGEQLTELPYEERLVTLVLADFSVNTKACYEAYDEIARTNSAPTGRNHLTPAARLVEPRLAMTMDWLAAEVGQEVHLAGSGATMFVEGHVGTGEGRWDVQGPAGCVTFVQVRTTPKA